jgi:hypothetical protein
LVDSEPIFSCLDFVDLGLPGTGSRYKQKIPHYRARDNGLAG